MDLGKRIVLALYGLWQQSRSSMRNDEEAAKSDKLGAVDDSPEDTTEPVAPASQNADSCAICWADMASDDGENPSTSLLPYCRHSFHSSCIGEWMAIKWSCPVCRRFALPMPEFPPLPAAVRNRLFFGQP